MMLLMVGGLNRTPLCALSNRSSCKGQAWGFPNYSYGTRPRESERGRIINITIWSSLETTCGSVTAYPQGGSTDIF